MEIVANAIQAVPANQDVLFTNVSVSGSPSILWREGSGLVTLRGLPNGQCRARFRASFGANVAVEETETVEPISLSISINGEPVPTSRMISTPAAVDEYNNVSADIYIDVPIGCCTQLSVENTSAITINVQNANFIVERVA